MIRELNELHSCCAEEWGSAEALIRPFPPPPVPPPGVSLTRSRPTMDDRGTNRLQWTYTVSTAGEKLVSRVVNLVPSQPEACP